MQFPGSVTQPKTTLPHSCPMASFTFLPLGQGLTSSNHVKPAESPRGFQASFQLNRPRNGLGWVSTGIQPHLTGKALRNRTIWASARRSSCLFQIEGTSLRSNRRSYCCLKTNESSPHQHTGTALGCWSLGNKAEAFWSNWFMAWNFFRITNGQWLHN